MINTACAVSYVAMIALGYSTAGVIGLVGMGVILIKRAGYMPQSIDRVLSPLSFLCEVTTSFMLPAPILIRVIQAITYPLILLHYAMHSKKVRSILPRSFTHPIPGKHIVKKNDKVENCTLEELKTLTSSSKSFCTNHSSIHAPEVSKIFPVDFEKTLEKTNPVALFKAIEKKIEERGITFTKEQQKGFAQLKAGLLKGRVVDTIPPDFENFKKVTIALLHTLEKDDANFTVRIKEFADIGLHCMEGWPREVSALLLPDSKEIKWAVHHQLALLRGACVLKLIRLIMPKEVTDLSGGANDIHLANAIHGALWPYFRTYEGEILHAIHPPSYLEALLINSQKNWGNGPTTKKDPAYLIFKLSQSSELGATAFHEVLLKNLPNLKKAYSTVDPLVNYIHKGIKPQYRSENGSLVCHRAIPWEATRDWIAKRGDTIDFYDSYGMPNKKWLETSLAGQQFLTKDAVRLLLFDMGILSKSPQKLVNNQTQSGSPLPC